MFSRCKIVKPFGEIKLLSSMGALCFVSANGEKKWLEWGVVGTGDSLVLKLCHCKDNLKFTDLHKPGEDGSVDQWWGTCQGRERGALLRSPSLVLPLLGVEAAVCKIKMECQSSHTSTCLYPLCSFIVGAVFSSAGSWFWSASVASEHEAMLSRCELCVLSSSCLELWPETLSLPLY